VNEAQKYRISGWNKPTPFFQGTSVEVNLKGPRFIELLQHGEVYECTSPRISFRMLPFMLTEWVGLTTITCSKTGYKAEVEFKPRPYFSIAGEHEVTGSLRDAEGKVVATLSGVWDKIVSIKYSDKEKSETLYDAPDCVEGVEMPEVKNLEALPDSNSLIVWRKLTAALLDEDWTTARVEKAAVENEQRVIRKERKERDEQWAPCMFTWDGDNWVWKDPVQTVDRAGLVAETALALQRAETEDGSEQLGNE